MAETVEDNRVASQGELTEGPRSAGIGMCLAAAALALTIALPASAHEDLDGSYDELSRALQGTVEAFVTDKLRAPKAAQYRGVRLIRNPKGELTICGQVNARNGYGGYNGFEPFAITIHGPNRWSSYVPVLFDIRTRPSLRAVVASEGC